MLQVYFDTEFTGLYRDTSLMSIGMVTRLNGKTRGLYCEANDYDMDKLNEWLEENVVENMLFNDLEDVYRKNKTICMCKTATFKLAHDYIIPFLQELSIDDVNAGGSGKIQLVSDVCHFDFVLFIDLFGTAFDLPSFVSPTCVDINEWLVQANLAPTSAAAFDLNREEVLKGLGGKVEIPAEEFKGKKHNAFWDACVIMELANKLQDKIYSK